MVRVDSEVVGQIGRGLLVLLAIEVGDGPAEVRVMADKLARLRVFEDPSGRMNLDLAEVGGKFLVVSQFTLAASLARGRRPSFDGAEKPALARGRVEEVMAALRAEGFVVEGGRFGAQMEVELVNDGPVTLILETKAGKIV